MEIRLIFVGKTDKSYLIEGENEYEKRLKHYLKFNKKVISPKKISSKMSADQVKKIEGELILNELTNDDYLILLDEKGKQLDSNEFSVFLQKKMNMGLKRLTFVVGGAYGFSDEVYEFAKGKISLSRMTFSHQMIRMFFLEQVYRSMTILKGESYHNN